MATDAFWLARVGLVFSGSRGLCPTVLSRTSVCAYVRKVAPLWPLVPERPPSVILDSRSGLLLYHHPPSFPSRPPSCTRVAYLKPVCPPPRRAPAETR
ncbi:hypothetical protein VFPFJ_02621 [Purpureocillium lilacinum]|uniref:Uncharacterized protein n=1 Tax=Purpureocillium lilacinum TaxID=33203 RepID=A0A179HVH8_PURLI|nr:hypothetical protein VFPFJ_02621 [Purpureocillium lilacinum]OAQ93459.1 hypothetical protein VFPFJ_02621 [Purpureocillium lilacinum]